MVKVCILSVFFKFFYKRVWTCFKKKGKCCFKLGVGRKLYKGTKIKVSLLFLDFIVCFPKLIFLRNSKGGVFFSSPLQTHMSSYNALYIYRDLFLVNEKLEKLFTSINLHKVKHLNIWFITIYILAMVEGWIHY